MRKAHNKSAEPLSLEEATRLRAMPYLMRCEAARLCRVHPDTIDAMGERGDISIVSIGRARRVVTASINKFFERQAQPCCAERS
jgi:hypothetical protein